MASGPAVLLSGSLHVDAEDAADDGAERHRHRDEATRRRERLLPDQPSGATGPRRRHSLKRCAVSYSLVMQPLTARERTDALLLDPSGPREHVGAIQHVSDTRGVGTRPAHQGAS